LLSRERFFAIKQRPPQIPSCGHGVMANEGCFPRQPSFFDRS
jgi:hypothetical protein